MSEPASKTPDTMIVTLTVGELREIVRQEIKASANCHAVLLTAEQLAEALQVNKATVYEWVKSKAIPYYQAGRFIRFSRDEVLQSQKRKVKNPS